MSNQVLVGLIGGLVGGVIAFGLFAFIIALYWDRFKNPHVDKPSAAVCDSHRRRYFYHAADESAGGLSRLMNGLPTNGRLLSVICEKGCWYAIYEDEGKR